MRKKAEILEKVLGTLESGGWRGLRARQLYFDRDEVTVFGWLDPAVARRGVQPPFELRSRKGRRTKPRGASRRKKR
jgi:hypothetical protein